MTNRIPLIVNAGAAQIQEVSASDVLQVPGNLTANVVQTNNYQYANGQPFTGGTPADIIYNGTSNVSIPVANGNVYINTNTNNTIGPWVFDVNGNLTLPGRSSGQSPYISTASGSNKSIILHPDGTGKVFVVGDNSQLFTVTSDTENQFTAMVVRSFGNTLGNLGGGTYVGSYYRPGAPVQSGDRLVAIVGRGSYDGANYSNLSSGRMQIMSGGTWTANSNPTYISFLNTLDNSTQQVENLRIEPNGNVTIYNGNVISKGAYIAGYDGFGTDAIYAGVSGFTILASNVIAQFGANIDSYAQINFQNISNGTGASTDYVLTADNGDDTTYFADFGIAGSNHADPAFFGDTGTTNDAYLYVVGADQTGTTTGSGNLILGSTNGQIKMFVGNTAQANVIATISSTGVEVNSTIVTTPVALSALTAVAGGRAFINDGNLAAVGNFGVQISGGASNTVPVWSDGSNWYIG